MNEIFTTTGIHVLEDLGRDELDALVATIRRMFPKYGTASDGDVMAAILSESVICEWKCTRRNGVMTTRPRLSAISGDRAMFTLV